MKTSERIEQVRYVFEVSRKKNTENELAAIRDEVINRELLGAAKKVLGGLNARIKAAGGVQVPVFDGIADLHDAIAKAEP